VVEHNNTTFVTFRIFINDISLFIHLFLIHTFDRHQSIDMEETKLNDRLKNKELLIDKLI
jgi:hypothetical protein